MPPKPVEAGLTGRAVAENLRRICSEQGLSLRKLAERMPEDRQLTHTQLSAIQRGTRAVSVDDLTALAVGLGVSPVALLLPPPQWEPRDDDKAAPDGTVPAGDTTEESKYRNVRLTGTRVEDAMSMLAWLRGDEPLRWETVARDEAEKKFIREKFIRRSLPFWAVKMQ